MRVFCKGGPEIVMPYCSKMLNEHGEEVELTEDKKKDILQKSVVKPFCDLTYRTILVAYRSHSKEEWQSLKAESNGFAAEADQEQVESNLVMVGIFGLVDPLRKGIKKAVL